jgi:hypothetical protein
MAPTPSGGAPWPPPWLPPHPKSPRTLPIDDFIQISKAARSEMGEEVVTDLISFMDKAGYTQTTGSFRITEGGIEMASVPRQSINGQVNIYIGSIGDSIIEENLKKNDGTYYAGVQKSAGRTNGISGTSGIVRAKGTIADTVNLAQKNTGRVGGVVSHEITHAIDKTAGYASGYDFAGSGINPRMEKGLQKVRELITNKELSPDEAFRQSGIMEAMEDWARGYGSSEALADTGKVSSLKRVSEADPELARRIGLDDSGEFRLPLKMDLDDSGKLVTTEQTTKRTFGLDILDKFIGNQLYDKETSLGSGYSAGEMESTWERFPGYEHTYRNELKKLGVSDEVLEESAQRQKAVAAANYAARVGGIGPEEELLFEIAAEKRGKSRITKSYPRNFLEELYDEEYKRQRVKGRFNIEIVDDVVDDVSEIVSQAKVKPDFWLAGLTLKPNQMPVTGHVSQALNSSLDDVGESVARRIPPQPVLEVGSGKATRKTLQRIVQSGMTAKRIAKNIF